MVVHLLRVGSTFRTHYLEGGVEGAALGGMEVVTVAAESPRMR
jgi:hypothetical protein